MALTAAGLKAAIKSELTANFPTPSSAGGMNGSTVQDLFAEAVANAVINYIKDNADVIIPGATLTTPTGGPVSGATLAGAVN